MTKTQLIKTQIAELETLAQMHYEAAKLMLSNGDKEGFELFMARTAKYDAQIDVKEAELLVAVKEQLAELESLAALHHGAANLFASWGWMVEVKQEREITENFDLMADAIEAAYPALRAA